MQEACSDVARHDILIGHNTVYCKLCDHSRWKSFTVFVDRLVLWKFSSEIACAIGLGHARLLFNYESFPETYSLVLQQRNLNYLQLYGIRLLHSKSTLKKYLVAPYFSYSINFPFASNLVLGGNLWTKVVLSWTKMGDNLWNEYWVTKSIHFFKVHMNYVILYYTYIPLTWKNGCQILCFSMWYFKHS